MRKYITIILSMICMLSLAACGKNDTYEIEIVIPAGSTEEFVYSDEEISPKRDTLTISTGTGIADTEVVLKTVEVKEENAYEPEYLTRGMPVKMDVEKGAWFKIGVAIQNPSDTDMTVSVEVEDVDVRISNNEELNAAVGIIGGADGPTSIFIAGRLDANLVPWIFGIGIVLIIICVVRLLKKRE
ncbi:MAG: hypothetical protein IJ024_07930 [Lachnospiraceae bacterium]|nr:hypothetical protein [Lachnospiraceae bacterium]